ncbi:MAG: prephenate dehydratase [Deinococcales bacterium]
MPSKTSRPRIAYQGIPGAYHEQASLQFNPDSEPIGYDTFEAAFNAARSGECDYACLAVENSLAGSINATYDLLSDSSLHVIGEQIVHVHHNLMVKNGVALKDVKRVYSHYQALAQCQGFIKKHGFEAVTEFDTAGAAKIIAARDHKDEAAIASRRAAEIYGLNILAENIEDEEFNYTRFFILGIEEAPYNQALKYKTSLLLATRNRPGDLVRCLEFFNNINMTKLESRPRRDKPWSYLFYIDIEGHIDDAHVSKALMGLMRRAAFVKFLGSYPAAAQVVES